MEKLTYKEGYTIQHRLRVLRSQLDQLRFSLDELEKDIFTTKKYQSLSEKARKE